MRALDCLLLTSAVGSGLLESRSPAGQQFLQALKSNSKLAEQYKQVGKGYGPQREFRLKWAQQEVDRCRETRIQRE
eukprot:560436-Alexandrium_andersonii.AAC.1